MFKSTKYTQKLRNNDIFTKKYDILIASIQKGV